MFNIIREYISQSKKIVTDQEFNDIYIELERDILEIEKIRKVSILKVLRSYFLAIIMFIVFIIMQRKIVIPQFVSLIFGIFISCIIMESVFEFIKNKKIYVNKYKSEILIKAIKGITPDVEYISKEKIDLNIYNEAKFDEASFNEYNSIDYIRINSENVINISRIILNKIIYQDNKDSKEEKYKIFDGIYSYVLINKNMPRIYLKKSLSSRERNGKIDLDSENFEKNFNIFSENRMVTMQLLTPKVMDEIISFINECAINFEIVIQDNKIHFKFYTGAILPPQYFDLNYKNRMNKNKRYVYYYYSIFKFIINIIDYFVTTLDELEV